MQRCRIAFALFTCLAFTSVAAAQSNEPTKSTGHGGDPGAGGGSASATTSGSEDANSMKGKIRDPLLLKNGSGNGQSPEVPTGVATQPGTNNTAPKP